MTQSTVVISPSPKPIIKLGSERLHLLERDELAVELRLVASSIGLCREQLGLSGAIPDLVVGDEAAFAERACDGHRRPSLFLRGAEDLSSFAPYRRNHRYRYDRSILVAVLE